MQKEKDIDDNTETEVKQKKGLVEYLLRRLEEEGDKIKDQKKREEYKKWFDRIESVIVTSPRADINFYMSLPICLVIQYLKDRDKKIKKEFLDNEIKNEIKS